MISFNLNKELNIVEVLRVGEDTYEENLQYINNIFKTFSNQKYLKVIDDSRKSMSKMTLEDVDRLYHEITKLMHTYNIEFLQTAIVVDKPYIAALTLWHEKNTKDIKNYSFRVFSTIEAAKKWI